MKKSSILFGVLSCLVFGSFAMEEGELTREEARKLYDDSTYWYFMTHSLTYPEYRDSMQKTLPLLGFTQSTNYEPLLEAARNNDYDFALFLLEHGADSNFVGMRGGISALQYVQTKLRETGDPEMRSLEHLLRTYQPRIKRN